VKYFFDLEGEDRTQFVWECDASDKRDALNKLDCVYPEATLLDMQTQEEYQDRESARYARLVYEMDNDVDLSGDNWF
jgi:hypothetical protein